jgi:hypothetical protein
MKQTARLIIPAWGEVYAGKLVSITLPAILAPGNLPALSEAFDVELVVVTETRLFDSIRNADSFQRASKFAQTRLVSLDDVMTDRPGDYGVVLTYALFRGFTDLGGRMTETYLLFLNADFIICDGSLRHLSKLMLEGKTVIHSPSFRVILEEVWPQLQARVDKRTCTLSLEPREMVRLALAHKHQTVKARIVNQRLSHQTFMDQCYWYVDEDTLIGYQLPVALVAIKPQRVVTVPVLVWDYGFIPEASPTAQRYFIDDSDNFFMLEPQSRETGDSMLRPGWISVDDIARNLSMWTTKEQRECGRHLLKIHAADLPPSLDEVAVESRAYMAQIYGRLSPVPLPHVGHGYLGPWFEEAKGFMRGNHADERVQGPLATTERSTLAEAASQTGRKLQFAKSVIRALGVIYEKTFGTPPAVGEFHPLWIDYHDVTQTIAEWRQISEERILWLSSRDSLFRRMLRIRFDPAALFVEDIHGSFRDKAPYDACLCELRFDELAGMNQLYAAIRPLMKDGGKIVFHVVRTPRTPVGDGLDQYRGAFPDVDISEIRFFGTRGTAALRSLYLRASASFPTRPLARSLATGIVLILLAPVVRLTNARAAQRDASIYSRLWTSLIIDFTVQRRRMVATTTSLPAQSDMVRAIR